MSLWSTSHCAVRTRLERRRRLVGEQPRAVDRVRAGRRDRAAPPGTSRSARRTDGAPSRTRRRSRAPCDAMPTSAAAVSTFHSASAARTSAAAPSTVRSPSRPSDRRAARRRGCAGPLIGGCGCEPRRARRRRARRRRRRPRRRGRGATCHQRRPGAARWCAIVGRCQPGRGEQRRRDRVLDERNRRDPPPHRLGDHREVGHARLAAPHLHRIELAPQVDIEPERLGGTNHDRRRLVAEELLERIEQVLLVGGKAEFHGASDTRHRLARRPCGSADRRAPAPACSNG